MKNAWIHFAAKVSALPLWQWWNPAGFLNGTPPATWPFEKADLVVVIGLLVLGLVAFIPRIPSGLRSRLLSFAWYNFPIAGILFLTRWQAIPVLGMDLWRLVQEIIMIVWLVSIVQYQLHHQPKEELQEKVKAYREKYLPKPNTR